MPKTNHNNPMDQHERQSPTIIASKTRRVPYLAPLAPLALCMMVGIVVEDSWHCPRTALLAALTGMVLAALLTSRWASIQRLLICLCFVPVGMLTIAGPEKSEEQSLTYRMQQQALAWRQQLLGSYQDIDSAVDARYAVLAAMTLGDKSALTKDIRATYSATGAAHLLALSGLHLGIIYMLVTTLLLGRRRFWLSQALIVVSIWAFAFLTGLSTSTVRSATMISIYALAAVGGRRRPSLNLLFFTAMVMLLFNGRQLFDIGFQLSFMAVLSILLLRPLAERLVSYKYLAEHPLQRWLWGTAWVSTAAQIGVAPLIAYYFGQFSTSFLLTNLLVLPLVTLILYGALFFLLTAWTFAGEALLWLVALLNDALALIARLPFAAINGLHPSVGQVLLLYLILTCCWLIALRLIPERQRY